jgi:hypothetical protein
MDMELLREGLTLVLACFVDHSLTGCPMVSGGLGESELSPRPQYIVFSFIGEPRVVFSKVAVSNSVGTKAGRQLQTDPFDTGCEALSFLGFEWGRVGDPSGGGGGEYIHIETGGAPVIFCGWVAPTAPSVSHLYRKRHSAQCVEVDETSGESGLVVHADIGHL